MADGAKAVFLDRDGTVIVDARYPRDPARIRFLPGAAKALRRLRRAGFLLVVVSNQSGVGRGIVTQEEAQAVHRGFVHALSKQGVELAGAYYCPHSPDEGCSCRKPLPGLLRRAAEELGIDLHGSYMVGDKQTDVEAGRRAGCVSVLFSPNGNGWEMVTELILAGLRR